MSQINWVNLVAKVKNVAIVSGVVFTTAMGIHSRAKFMCLFPSFYSECSYRMHSQGKKFLKQARLEAEKSGNAKMLYEAAAGEFSKALKKNNEWLFVEKSKTYTFLLESYIGAGYGEESLKKAQAIKNDSLHVYVPKDDILRHQVFIAELYTLKNKSKDISSNKIIDFIDEREYTYRLSLNNRKRDVQKAVAGSILGVFVCGLLASAGSLYMSKKKVSIIKVGKTPDIRQRLHEYSLFIQSKSLEKITDEEKKILDDLSNSIRLCSSKLSRYENAVERLQDPRSRREKVDEYWEKNREKRKKRKRK